MFLHLGDDVMVPKKDVIAILDVKAKQWPSTKDFLEIAKDEGFIKNVSKDEKEKTFVITNDSVYLSPISCSTLKKRSQNITAVNDEV